MVHPAKWRETIDPFSLALGDFQLERIVGYPHAGNDVFHVEGRWQERPCRAYLKVARQRGADLRREAALLQKLSLNTLPRLLAWQEEEPCWLLTEELPGERLSVLLEGQEGTAALDYLPAYGRTLAEVHSLTVDCPAVADRRFFHVPEEPYFAKWGLEEAAAYLAEQPCTGVWDTFVHGDFHYANLLWHNGVLSGVLDWELAGMGNREFDMAWAVFCRPGQRFLHTWREVEGFLQGYGQKQSFCRGEFCRHYVRIAAWFFPMGEEHDREIWRKLVQEAMAEGRKSP